VLVVGETILKEHDAVVDVGKALPVGGCVAEELEVGLFEIDLLNVLEVLILVVVAVL
jgi:hypothetical protein